jgi:hypothetical protein
MILKIIFGEHIKKEVGWNKDLNHFPHVILYEYKKWEWVMYTGGSDPDVSYDLTFIEIPSYTKGYYTAEAVNFEDILRGNTLSDECQCGAKYTGFSWDHMRFCNKWKPWSYL